ncbi:MAG: UDP-N-acetylmuramate dehydrogenase [Acutalibacteraceae bacterium]|nr:UDP-N-acetylmuramate dehydrogenase [Acutalibacteraceae bacterium]
MSSYSKLYDLCKEIECEYSTDALLKDYTSFKIGGKAEVMIFPDSIEKLSKVYSLIKNENLSALVLGKGSNMLVADSGFNGVVINTCKLDKIYLIDETTVVCHCGVSLSKLCRFALENSLTGLEFAFGIPGTAGGAAYMNAGAYGGEMKDVLVSCEHINPDGSIGDFTADELKLSYRHSVYSDSDMLITTLTLRLSKGNPDEIKAKMDELMGKRRDKQPLEYPSAGSTFKRPEGYFAGALIEQCNLKGYTSGGAQVSEKHAGFVVNKGGATAADVIAVIEHCQKTVYENTGVLLEPEVKIIK